MPPESATENSVPFVEIFSETPAIPEYLRKVHEGNSVPFVELFSENPAISKYIK